LAGTQAAKIMRHQAVKSRVLRVEQGGSLSVSAFATYDKGEATLATVANNNNRNQVATIVTGAAAALSVQDVVIGGETKGKALNFNVLAALPFVKNLFSKSKNKDNITIPYEPEKPKSYIEIAIFADSLQTELLTTKQLPISENAEYFWEKLQDSLVFEQAGFAVVSLKNSSDLPVLFDNLELTLYGTTEAMIVQENHYEPLGMTLKGLDYVLEERQKNRFLYNGKELDESLDLQLYDYHARQVDPQLGRMHGVDPMAEKFASVSPFNYALNNPIIIIDPTGMEAKSTQEMLQEAWDNTKEGEARHFETEDVKGTNMALYDTDGNLISGKYSDNNSIVGIITDNKISFIETSRISPIYGTDDEFSGKFAKNTILGSKKVKTYMRQGELLNRANLAWGESGGKNMRLYAWAIDNASRAKFGGFNFPTKDYLNKGFGSTAERQMAYAMWFNDSYHKFPYLFSRGDCYEGFRLGRINNTLGEVPNAANAIKYVIEAALRIGTDPTSGATMWWGKGTKEPDLNSYTVTVRADDGTKFFKPIK
jgi:RHS repeat-associated protein